MRPEKQLLLDDIKDKIAASKALVLTAIKSSSRMLLAGFACNLGKIGGSLEVVKKRCLIKAAKGRGRLGRCLLKDILL